MWTQHTASRPKSYCVADNRRAGETPMRSPLGNGAAMRHLDTAGLLALQRTAGNAAVGAVLASRRTGQPVVQRCGDHPCDCAEEEREAAAGLPRPESLQLMTAGEATMRRPGLQEGERQSEPGEGRITSAALITGALVRGSGPTSSGGQRLCFPPAAFTNPQFGSGFGTIAERLIEQDYCDTLGCAPTTTFIDNFNPTAYRAFLVSHNPSLRSRGKAIALAVASATGIARPDIMCDDGARKDYYEIKPLSPSGVAAGLEKLAEIAAFMAALGLPYVPGTIYSPSKDIPIMSGLVIGEPLTVSLNVNRFVPGLVTYSLCLEGNLAEILAKVALAALLAWIAAELLAAAGVLVLA